MRCGDNLSKFHNTCSLFILNIEAETFVWAPSSMDYASVNLSMSVVHLNFESYFIIPQIFASEKRKNTIYCQCSIPACLSFLMITECKNVTRNVWNSTSVLIITVCLINLLLPNSNATLFGLNFCTVCREGAINAKLQICRTYL